MIEFDPGLHRAWACPAEGGWFAYQPLLEGGVASWFDLTHERRYVVRRVLRDEPELLEFEDDAGRVLWLRPLTLEHYERFRAARGGGRKLRSVVAVEDMVVNVVKRGG